MFLKRFISCLLLCGALCCILLTGCEPKKPAGPPEQLTIAIPTSINPILVKIAEAKGFFREEGLDITLQLHSSGKAALQSLLDGKADLATAADTPIMFAMMKDAKLSILATICITTKDDTIIARKDRGITGASDLKGRRIGVALGTSSDYFLDTYLTLNALSRNDVVIVDMKPEEKIEALVQGKIDAASTWQPAISNLRRKLGERATTLHSDTIYTKTFDLISLQTLTRQRPEAVRRILRALVRAEIFVAANPEKFQRIMSEFSGMDSELLTGIRNDFQYNITLNQSLPVTLEDQARWAMKSGLTDRRDLPNFFGALYIDGLKSVKPKAVRVIQ